MIESIQLPTEILFSIFGRLGPQELLRLRRVCKQYKGVAEDELLWQRLGCAFPKFPACVNDCRGEARHWCFKQLSGSLPSAAEVAHVMEDAAEVPKLVQFGRESYLLYRFQSDGSQGVRLRNLATGQFRDYATCAEYFDRMKYHYVGLEDLFVVIEQQKPRGRDQAPELVGNGYCQTLTFLNSQLRPTGLPELSRGICWPVSHVEPLRAGTAIVGVMLVHHPVDSWVYHLTGGSWKLDYNADHVKEPLIRSGSGIQLIHCGGDHRTFTLQGRQWTSTENKFVPAWEVPIGVENDWWLDLQRSVPFHINDRNYVVIHAANMFRIIRCPIGGEQSPVQWSFNTIDRRPTTTIRASALGSHILLSIQKQAQHGGLLSSRWLLRPDGKVIKLIEYFIEKHDGSICLGAVDTGEHAEYWYKKDSQELLRLELEGGLSNVEPSTRIEELPAPQLTQPPRGQTNWSLLKGLLVVGTLYVSMRHIEALAAFASTENSRAIAWAKSAFFGAAVFPLAGALSREVQERNLSQDRQWVALVPLAALAGLVWYQTKSQSLLCASWEWGLASLAAWNRSWPVVREELDRIGIYG
jgi:hypothetical protein